MDEEWKLNTMLDYDHYQDIARASFGDMLYDNDRVNIYNICK